MNTFATKKTPAPDRVPKKSGQTAAGLVWIVLHTIPPRTAGRTITA